MPTEWSWWSHPLRLVSSTERVVKPLNPDEVRNKISNERVAEILAFTLPHGVIPDKEHLWKHLEQILLSALMRSCYALWFYTIQAVEHLCRIVADNMHQIPWSFTTITGEELMDRTLPDEDKNFLNYIFSLHLEEANFRDYFILQVIEQYHKRAEQINTNTWDTEEDHYRIFKEIAYIIPFVLESLVQALKPYSVYPQECPSWVILAFKRR